MHDVLIVRPRSRPGKTRVYLDHDVHEGLQDTVQWRCSPCRLSVYGLDFSALIRSPLSL